MASSNSVKDCPICQEEYDEEVRCPRSLPCSHTICSKCIGNLISRNYKTCPFCIRVFHATAARDIGMNTSLLDVLKVLREIESKVYISQMPTAGIASDKMNDIKIAADDILNKLLDSFLEEDDEIETNLQSNDQLTSYFLQANDTMKKEVLSHINEVMAQNVNRIKYLQEHSRRLHLRKEVIKEKRKEVTDVKRKLTSSSTFMHVGASLDEVESIQTDAEDSKRTFKCGLSEDERVRLKLERVSKTMKDNITKLKEAVKPTEKDDEINFIPDLQHMKIPKKMEMGIRIAQFPLPIPQQVTTETLRSRTAFVMDLVKQGQIFAVQKQAGRITYAQISLEEKNRVVLHYLREQIIPANAHLLNHNDVLRLVNASSRLVFLELQSHENKHTLGKLYIRLSPNTKRARQFAILCSGEKGKTYVGSEISWAADKCSSHEHVLCGNYENLGGEGGRWLLPDVLQERGGVLKRPWLAGTIHGQMPGVQGVKAAQFWIYLRDRPGWHLEYCFGMVEEGLPILQDVIASYEDITKVIFSDGGFVLDI